MQRRLRFLGRVFFCLVCCQTASLSGANTWAQDASADATHLKAAALLERCKPCHSGAKQEGGLNLATRELGLKGGISGAAFVSGDAEKSLLYQRVAARQMPPGNPLSTEEIALLRTWITEGAKWSDAVEKNEKPTRAGTDWWSLQRLTRPLPPKVKNSAWVRTPIDAFVLAELEKKHLAPAPPADRATLLRRVTFDLLGVPPTPQERDAFLNDKAPNAYDRLVDRLLADPRYGERWGRHWLDVARFSESHGFERDQIRDHAWRYRDYVIQSFNADKPYAQFITEQIAGDVVKPQTQEGVIATGFLVAGPWDEVGNTQVSDLMKRRVREEEMEDMVSAVSQTFLGMTVNCARCHDHKFDPIPQRDYYRIKSALDGVRHGNRALIALELKAGQDTKGAKFLQDDREREREIARIERTGRERFLVARGIHLPAGAPVPLAQWKFEADGHDAYGNLNGVLLNGAFVSLNSLPLHGALVDGRLHLGVPGAYLLTAPLPVTIREKTLEAWVRLPNLTQRGGGIISLQTLDGKTFDAIVFGEREPGKWSAGSDFFRRTKDIDAPTESAKPEETVHIAAVYSADNSIQLYRNGVPYGAAYTPKGDGAALQTFPANEAQILIGLRHQGAGNGFFTGAVEEARLYDRALTAREISASFQHGLHDVGLPNILKTLTPEERKRRDTLLAGLRPSGHEPNPPATANLAYAANPVQPEPTYVLLRGDIESKGELVSAGGLSCARTLPADLRLPPDAPEGERRLRLAAWIADPANPLTARVLVNRIWHYHFGKGIVGTPNDFGFNGEPPTHPKLLDWLATEFMGIGKSAKPSNSEAIQNPKSKIQNTHTRHPTPDPFACGGSLKKLHRLILLSSVYRQSAGFNAKAAAVDAEDRLLWRFAPRRLEGEAVRDAMLCVSGQINYQRGGPGFRPFNVTINNSHFYTLTDPVGPEFNRRTVYRINVQSARPPLLESLDCPDPSTKTPRRAITTTPLQALELMNNSFVLRQANNFAQRLQKEAGNSPAAQITLAYRLAFGRSPTPQEQKEAGNLAQEHGLESLCWALLNATEFLYVK